MNDKEFLDGLKDIRPDVMASDKDGTQVVSFVGDKAEDVFRIYRLAVRYQKALEDAKEDFEFILPALEQTVKDTPLCKPEHWGTKMIAYKSSLLACVQQVNAITKALNPEPSGKVE